MAAQHRTWRGYSQDFADPAPSNGLCNPSSIFIGDFLGGRFGGPLVEPHAGGVCMSSAGFTVRRAKIAPRVVPRVYPISADLLS
jgi:hypothetical protein